MSKQFTGLYGSYLGTTGNSTLIEPTFKYLTEYVQDKGWFNIDYDVQDEYLDNFTQWIQSSKLNKVNGLETFPFKYKALIDS